MGLSRVGSLQVSVGLDDQVSDQQGDGGHPEGGHLDVVRIVAEVSLAVAYLAAVNVVLARVALPALGVAIPGHDLVLADLQQAALKKKGRHQTFFIPFSHFRKQETNP